MGFCQCCFEAATKLASKSNTDTHMDKKRPMTFIKKHFNPITSAFVLRCAPAALDSNKLHNKVPIIFPVFFLFSSLYLSLSFWSADTVPRRKTHCFKPRRPIWKHCSLPVWRYFSHQPMIRKLQIVKFTKQDFRGLMFKKYKSLIFSLWFHQSIVFHLSRVGSWWQQIYQGSPNWSLAS